MNGIWSGRTWTGRAWSCTIRVVVTDAAALPPAVADLQALLGRVEHAASRFRIDSALSVANERAGRPTPIPRILVDLVAAALAAAAQSGGAVDPTLGLAMNEIGYDRDIDLVRAADTGEAHHAAAQPLGAIASSTAGKPSSRRWQAVRLDRELGLLTVPRRTALDLGATAKAWTADRASRMLADRYGCGVLVELGGDVAVAGPAPDGWCIRVAERADEAMTGPAQVVRIRNGGIATSTMTIRSWRREGRPMHHILDPRTGLPATGPWRTATVAATSALQANIASTSAIVTGDDALARLAGAGMAARLVAQDGTIHATPNWPSPAPARAEARTLVDAGGRR